MFRQAFFRFFVHPEKRLVVVVDSSTEKVWFGLVRFGSVRYGLVWFGLVGALHHVSVTLQAFSFCLIFFGFFQFPPEFPCLSGHDVASEF